MRKEWLAVGVALAATALLAGRARAEFPFAADPNRCDTSGNPPGCIPLPNEMSGAAGSCNLTSLTLRRLSNGTFRLSVRGRNAELSTFDGTTDRTIVVGVDVGNDCTSASVNFRRTGPHLRSQP